MKIAQPLTKEVGQELVEPGEFFNTGTGESVGNVVEFIVAYFHKGRSAADRDSGRYYVGGFDTIPDHWGDLVGEEFVGTPFAEFPDAEEQYKQRVNRKEIPWGKGPLVSTTYNFTGFALVEDPETGETEYQPVRLSLQRTGKSAAQKWHTLRASKLRNKPWWGRVFSLGTDKATFDKGMAYLLTVKLGRETTPDEQSAATELALSVQRGNVVDNAESESATDKPAKPADDGALEV